MKVFKRILAALLFAALIASAAVYLPLPDRPNEPVREAPPPAAVSIRYREAEMILIAVCTRVAQPEGEQPVSKFTAEEVLVGSFEVGSAFSLPVAAESGRQYLLYLKTEKDPDDPETTYLAPVGEGLVTVDDGTVTYEGTAFTLESVREDIIRQQKVLTVPTQTFFYSDFDSLVNACDEVVAARVLSVSEPTETVCRSAKKGESTVSTLKQVFMRIRVENGLYGAFSSGDKLNVVLEPYSARPVINATDLTIKTVSTPPESMPKVGNVYLFFLLKSEDVKSDRYFTINPYEGYVLLVGNSIIHPYYNSAMSEVNDLRIFAERLRALRGEG